MRFKKMKRTRLRGVHRREGGLLSADGAIILAPEGNSELVLQSRSTLWRKYSKDFNVTKTTELMSEVSVRFQLQLSNSVVTFERV